MRKIDIFFHALDNEIAIDADVVCRMREGESGFVPIRPLKSEKWFKFGENNKFLYLFLCFSFLVFYIPYVVFRSLSFFSKKGVNVLPNDFEALLLNANGKAVTCFERIDVGVECYSFDFFKSEKSTSMASSDFSTLLCFSDLVGVFFDSIISVPIYFFRRYSFINVIQLYVCFDWFAAYRSLEILLNKYKFNSVFFANHYDRWAILFDEMFKNKNLILMQHGTFLNYNFVPHKLKNLNFAYCLGNNEVEKLSTFVSNAKSIDCRLVQNSIELGDAGVSGLTILIIGQPQSALKEKSLIKILANKMPDVGLFLKPHPVYGEAIYGDIFKYVSPVTKGFFPRVDIAVCYESTLGFEYEASGVSVLWWENRDPEDMAAAISAFLENA